MSLIKKLRLKDIPLYLLRSPENCASYFDDLEQKRSLEGKATIEQALLFAQEKKVLESDVPKLVKRLSEDAVFWVAYPKKSGSIKSDITRDNGWDVMKKLKYDAVTQVAIDSDWSALRFRRSKLVGPKLRDIPMADRKVEGIDFANRKVTLPKDVAKALQPHKELLQLFNSQPFTHQKEHIEAVVTAKKPETRARRINKMIEILEQTLQAKKKK